MNVDLNVPEAKFKSLGIEIEELHHLKDDIDTVDNWLNEMSVPLDERIKLLFLLRTDRLKLPEYSFYYKIPIINVFYETFFDRDNTKVSIEGILELFGIVGALMFPIAMALATNYRYDEFEEAKLSNYGLQAKYMVIVGLTAQGK